MWNLSFTRLLLKLLLELENKYWRSEGNARTWLSPIQCLSIYTTSMTRWKLQISTDPNWTGHIILWYILIVNTNIPLQPMCSGIFFLMLNTSFAFDELPEVLCSFCFCLRCFAIALALSTGSPHNGCNTPLYFGTSLAIVQPSPACLPSSILSSSGFRA